MEVIIYILRAPIIIQAYGESHDADSKGFKADYCTQEKRAYMILTQRNENNLQNCSGYNSENTNLQEFLVIGII